MPWIRFECHFIMEKQCYEALAHSSRPVPTPIVHLCYRRPHKNAYSEAILVYFCFPLKSVYKLCHGFQGSSYLGYPLVRCFMYDQI